MRLQSWWFSAKDYFRRDTDVQIDLQEVKLVRNIPLHQHEQVELMYVVSGKAEITVNGIPYSMTRGSFINLNPYHFYRIVINQDLVVRYCIFPLSLPLASYIKVPSDKQVMDYLYESAPVVQLNERQQGVVEAQFDRMLQERREGALMYESMLIYGALELQALYQRYCLQALEEEMDAAAPLPEWEAVKIIMLSTQQNVELEELAAKYDMQPTALEQKIRLATGYSFRQLVQQSKMLNVCALLSFPDLPITYIAKLYCYSSTNTFYREFKRYTGTTPEAYRKEHKPGAAVSLFANHDLALQLVIYIHLHYREPITIEHVAEEFRISASSVHKYLKGRLGTTFAEMLTHIRVQYAAVMLRVTDYAVQDVAVMVGFDSITTFGRAFRAAMYESPGTYRKKMRPDESETV